MKRNLIIGTIICLLFTAFAAAQGPQKTAVKVYQPSPAEQPSEAGALTPEDLAGIAASIDMTSGARAARNALARNKISAVVVNNRRLLKVDDLFTHVIKKSGSITSQDRTGRCWLFAGLNILRPPVIAKYKLKDFKLSQAYDQFWDKLERANRTLELAIALKDKPVDCRKNEILLKRPIDDGGDWNYVVKLVDKYGVVPKELMPDTYSAGHTSQMNTLLAGLVRKGILDMRTAAGKGADVARLREIKKDTLKKVYKVLVLCLGEPPATFEWRYKDKDEKVSALKSYTPTSFYTDFVGGNLDDYVAFTNYPGKPMHAKIEWDWNRDSADGPNMAAVNVTPAEMGAMAKDSIMADEAVWFACNASIQGDRKHGYWVEGSQDYSDLFGLDFSMSKADRLAYWNGAPNHAMALVGVDVENDVPVKWKVENSWGKKAGDEGYFIITKDWFDLHVYELIVNKKYVPKKLMKYNDAAPVVMPPWDPFS